MTSTGTDLTYDEALRALAARGRFGIRLGLGRTRALLRELDHPERTVRGALIAGTNGKGSVLALADVGAAGRRLSRRLDAQAAPRHLSRADLDRRAADRRRRLRPAGRARPADRRPGRAPPRRADRVRAADRGRLRPVRRGPAGRRAGRGRARRAARRDARLGRRRRRRHQRRPRPHGPARRHDREDRPREGRDHRARRPGRHRRDAVTGWRSSAGGRDGSACR